MERGSKKGNIRQAAGFPVCNNNSPCVDTRTHGKQIFYHVFFCVLNTRETLTHTAKLTFLVVMRMRAFSFTYLYFFFRERGTTLFFLPLLVHRSVFKHEENPMLQFR
jgi:hypothetical protein